MKSLYDFIIVSVLLVGGALSLAGVGIYRLLHGEDNDYE